MEGRTMQKTESLMAITEDEVREYDENGGKLENGGKN